MRYNVAFTKKGNKFVAPTLLKQSQPFHLIGDMSEYLLLRNNKQSGPFTLDDLRSMGLKAYDLLWIEGKSAAWRYPSEIEELKAFAPTVEEQPYDRFFKKPVAETRQVTAVQAVQQTSLKTELYAPAVQEPAPAHETVIKPGRPIYVTMPAGRRTIEKEPAPVTERKPSTEDKPRINEEAQPKSFIKSISPLPDEQMQEDRFPTIKKQSILAIPAMGNNRPARITRWIRAATVFFGLLALVALGVIIGLLISGRRMNSTKQGIADTEAGVQGQQAVYKMAKTQHPAQEPVAGETINDKPVTASQQPANQDQEAASVQKKKSKAVKPVISDSLTVSKPPVENKSSEALIPNRETVHKSAAPDMKQAIRDNITDYVSLSASKYTVGTFGGISDLQLTVTNRSGYPLDLVVVEVRYIQSNKKTFKTENIYFHDIGTGAAVMEEAPKSSRGIKVQYRITIINSKDLELAYSDL